MLLRNTEGRYGEIQYSCTRKGYRIKALAYKPMVMATCDLRRGPYLFEVELIKRDNEVSHKHAPVEHNQHGLGHNEYS